MTSVRRRVLRPQLPRVPATSMRLVERWQRQLVVDEQAFKRWMAKLKRAVNTLDRLQVRISRLRRHLTTGDRSRSS